MKKLTIAFDQPQIEVNGIVFDLHKSDGDIMQDAIILQEKYAALDTHDAKAVVELSREVSGYVDAILGKGAMKKISGGRPVSILKTLEVMTQIAAAAADSYSEHIAAEYD